MNQTISGASAAIAMARRLGVRERTKEVSLESELLPQKKFESKPFLNGRVEWKEDEVKVSTRALRCFNVGGACETGARTTAVR